MEHGKWGSNRKNDIKSLYGKKIRLIPNTLLSWSCLPCEILQLSEAWHWVALWKLTIRGISLTSSLFLCSSLVTNPPTHPLWNPPPLHLCFYLTSHETGSNVHRWICYCPDHLMEFFLVSFVFPLFILIFRLWLCVYIYIYIYTGLFISPSGISELDYATTKTVTAERSISISRESLQVFLY